MPFEVQIAEAAAAGAALVAPEAVAAAEGWAARAAAELLPGAGQLARSSANLLGAPSRLATYEADSSFAQWYSKEAPQLIENVKGFAEDFVHRFPQVRSDGTLDYYFAGSIGNTLSLNAARLTELDASKLPGIVPLRTLQVPTPRLPTFGFARKIGDMDFVLNPERGGLYEQMGRLNEALDVSEINSFKAIAKYRESQILLDAKSFFYSRPNDVVGINVNGKMMYAINPRSALAQKTLDGVWDRGGKFVRDYQALFDGSRSIYSDESIISRARVVLDGRRIPKSPQETLTYNFRRVPSFETLLRSAAARMPDSPLAKAVEQTAKVNF
jgi:hypothetical protein